MGVAEEIDGSVRKRPRLSLRTTHKSGQSKQISQAYGIKNCSENTQDSNQSSIPIKMQDMSGECSDSDPMADIPSSPDPFVAPVASLHNIGNTCFLNSVLQVLRYTPGFLDGLSKLREEILTEESFMDKESSDGDHPKLSLNWQVVKNTYSMYKEMHKKEEQYLEIATADSSSMAVRPSVLLDNIRELNPMFEGHFQHDAQELLRCLLCYVEDAEKELLQLRLKDSAKPEQIHTDIDVESKYSGHIPDVSEKSEMSLTAKETTSNSWDSLKGGECQNYCTSVTQRRSSSSLAMRAHVANAVNYHKNSVDSFSISHDKVKAKNRINVVDGDTVVNDHTAFNNGREEIDLLKQSPLPESISRKRKRYRSPLNDNSKHVLDHIAESVCVSNSSGLNKKTVRLNTSDDSISVGKCKQDENKVASRSHRGHSTVSPIKTSDAMTELVEVQKMYSSNDHFYQHLQNKLIRLSNSSNSSKTPSKTLPGGTDSAKQSILSVLPLNPFRQLGLRGPVNQTSHIAEGIHVIQVDDDDDVNNNGDINNNSDSLMNSNGNVGYVTTSSQEEVFIGLLEEMPECQSCSRIVSPLCVGDNVSSAMICTPSKTVMGSPVKSPIMVAHSDEISSILESDRLCESSGIDSVTTKYYCSHSQTDSSAFSLTIPSSSSVSSRSRIASHSLYADSQANSDVPCPVSSRLHVLEPNKEINVTVWQSPKKQCTALLISDDNSKLFVSSHDKSPCDKLLSSDDRTKYLLPSGDAYLNGIQNHEDSGDPALRSSICLTDKKTQNDRLKLTELHMSAKSEPPSLKVARTCYTNQRRLRSCSPYVQSQLYHRNLANRLEMFSHVYSREIVNAYRSPGAIVHTRFMQPKLELKKCDWLAVSPVRSIGARKAIYHQRTFENASSAGRKILCEDSQSNSFSFRDSNAEGNRAQSDPDSQKDHKDTYHASSDLDSQKDHKDTDHAYSDPNNREESNIKEITVSSFYKKANEKKVKLKKTQVSILNFTEKYQRRSQKSIARREFSHTENLVGKKNISYRGLSLKALSVTLDNCDWLLGAEPGKPISAKQAIINIKMGRRIVLQSKNCSREISHSENQLSVNAGSSLAEVKPQNSPSALIEKLFGGTMMHQTKCLECEVARQRQEVFMDISVPVRSLNSGPMNDGDDSDDRTHDKSGSSCLSKLIQAFSSVERLIDTNKYFCEHCLHYVEAERSCHYLTLPAVLTLHLKRFSTRLFGGVSKLVDKVSIPQNLPCLQYQCMGQCSDSSHKYSLFAIITHSGTSILHGHYRAYVKVQHQVNPSVYRNLSNSKVKVYTHRYVRTKVNTVDSRRGEFRNDEPCYSSRVSKSYKSPEVDEMNGTCAVQENIMGAAKSNLVINYSEVDKKLDIDYTVKLNVVKSDDSSDGYRSFWLECDDESIKVMDEDEFAEKLEEKDGCLLGTPYVLFYQKLLE